MRDHLLHLLHLLRLPDQSTSGGYTVSLRKPGLGVDHLPPPTDLPVTVLGAVVSDGNIAASFKAMRYAARVPSVAEPLAEGVARTADDLLQGECFRRAKGLDGIREL